MTFSAKAALIKFCRFAPPLITQVATFVATRALANEYADYGADRAHVPLGAKLTLISITILSAVTGLLTVLGTWKSSEKPKAIKAGDVLLQLVALVIAVWAGSSMLTDHGVLEAEGKKCDGPNARVSRPKPARRSPAPQPHVQPHARPHLRPHLQPQHVMRQPRSGSDSMPMHAPSHPLTLSCPPARPPLVRCACRPLSRAPTRPSRRATPTST